MLGGSITWIYNGRQCLAYEDYLARREQAKQDGKPFQTLVLYEAFDWIYQIFGWQACILYDSIVFYATDRYDEAAEYLVDHLIRCTYTTEIDGSQRQYSLMGGVIVTAVWFGGLAILATILLSAFPMLLQIALLALLVASAYFLLITTYGWSAWCSAPPDRLFYDASLIFTYTLLPKCNPLLGGLVLNSTWNANTCYRQPTGAGGNGDDGDLSWTFAECRDFGFRTIFDNLAYYRLWLGTDLGLGELLEPIYAVVWGSPTPSINFTNWDTDPVLHSVFGQCSIITALPTALMGLTLILIALVVIVHAVKMIPALILANFILLTNAIRYIMLASTDTFKMLNSLDKIARARV
jgi:hypothetical protein